MADWGARDFNGQCYVEGSEGERYVRKDSYVVFVPNGLGAPTWLADGKEDHSNIVIADNVAQQIIAVNMRIVINDCESNLEAFWVAYLRYLCIKNGWISDSYAANQHHCAYRETANDPAGIAVINDEKLAEILVEDFFPSNAELEDFRLMVYDYVGLLAYVFRARGHHYLDDEKFEASLVKIWKAMQYDENDIPIRFKIGFTLGLHAIFPDVLDTFWLRAANNARVAGALIKRIDVAAAGSAIMSSLYRGVSDIRVTIPKLPADLEEQWDHFLAIHEHWRNHRWDYSVNARLYGVARIRIREDQFSVLASYVVAVYRAIDDNAALVGSKALERNAIANPVTGYIMQRATLQMIDKFSMALAYGPQLHEIRQLLQAEAKAD